MIQLWIRAMALCELRLAAIGYGGLNITLKLLVLGGIVSVSEIDPAGFWGHLLVWDPIWIVGGVLLVAVAWQSRSA